MTPRQLKWLTIGEAFETEPEERTEGRYGIAYLGLCDAMDEIINYFSAEDYVSFCKTMRLFTEDHPEITSVDTWWPTSNDDDHTRQCDFERAFFAYLMAAISDDDYNEMIGDQHD